MHKSEFIKPVFSVLATQRTLEKETLNRLLTKFKISLNCFELFYCKVFVFLYFYVFEFPYLLNCLRLFIKTCFCFIFEQCCLGLSKQALFLTRVWKRELLLRAQLIFGS